MPVKLSSIVLAFNAQLPNQSASASLSAADADVVDAAAAAPGRGGSGSFSSCLGKALGRRESLPGTREWVPTRCCPR